MKRITAAVLCIWMLTFFLTSCGGEPVKDNTLTEADLDLTQLSSTMVYSEVYNMTVEPESYMGKTVRMTGAFAVYEDETGRYFACIISDATACCAQGLEFAPKDTYHYPDDFPAVGAEITVEGRFNVVSEGQYRYIVLEDADMTH